MVKDSKGATSAEGTVTFVPPGGVIAGSDFTTGADNWSVVDNGSKQGIVHESISQGLLNFFVYSVDDVFLIDPKTKDDQRQWSFQAPSKFLGYQLPAYGGRSSLYLVPLSGDFASQQTTRNSVVLECTSCNMHKGMRFIARNLIWDGQPKKFSIPMVETAFAKDPKSTLATAMWNPPTQCEMMEMLSDLSAVRILGDYTQWHEAVGLDDIMIYPGLGLASSTKNANVNCLCANPGTQCSYAALS